MNNMNIFKRSIIDYINESNQIDNNKSLLDQGFLFDKIRNHGWHWNEFDKRIDLSEYKDKLKNKKIEHPQLGWWAEISTGQGKHIGNNLSATFTSKCDLKWDRMNYDKLAPIIYCLLCESDGIEKFSKLIENKNVDFETNIKGKQITITIKYIGDSYCKITFKK